MSGIAQRKDLVGGALMTLIGAGTSVFCALSYDLGTARLIGAGLFPTALGAILAVLGALIAFTGRNRPPEGYALELRSVAAVLGALAAFVLAGRWFGMVPGIVALVFVAALGVGRLGLAGKAILALAMVAVGTAVFHMLLGMQLPLLRWPFR